jgi:hypothetical protein
MEPEPLLLSVRATVIRFLAVVLGFLLGISAQFLWSRMPDSSTAADDFFEYYQD